MNKHIQNFRLCLSFLTRFCPGPIMDRADFSKTLVWFVPCGLLLGLVLCLPIWLLPDIPPLALAWMVVMLEIYLTRGLHWDGWGDLWDGWGSNARGEEFWRILKDSRTGVFAVLAITSGIGGEIVLLSAADARWTSVVWAMLLGRLVPVIQAFFSRELGRPGLGSSFLSGAGMGVLAFSIIFVLLAGIFLVGPFAVLISATLLTLITYKLHTSAKSQEGLNGDFLGAGIIAGQLAGFLSFVLA
ncbi:MAG: adenosylcobinamide-GDP ribazoletransferase [Thermodesulfobacteriota bacterium]